MEIGGINASQIVADLMALEAQPLSALEARQETAKEASSALSALKNKIDSFGYAALRLAGADAFSRFTASSSDSSAVTASASESAVPSSLSFTVTQLASNHGLRSVGTVASADTVVTSASALSFLVGGSQLGISAADAASGLTAGDHTISITQASDSARRTGSGAVAGSQAANGTLELSINGGASISIGLTAGTSAADAATAIDAALDAHGASAALDGDGRLVVITDREGSAASVQITAGSTASTLTDLGLAVDASAVTGIDAVVAVGDETTTLTSVEAGGTGVVTTAEGDLNLTFDGGLRVGTVGVTTVDLGGGTLAEVATAINNSQGGISAAAVRVSDDAWRLQLSSGTSGDDGEIVLDTSVFDAALGGMIESSPFRNAQLTIGEGVGAYTVESSSNSFTDVLAGTTISVSAVAASPVTVSVERNATSLAADVKAMVDAANAALIDVKVQTRYGVDGAGEGLLAGNGTVRRVADQLRTALSYPVDGISDMIGAQVGIEIQRDGTFSFNEATFTAALEADPAGVARYFGRGAQVPATTTFLDAAAETRAGTYAVEVNTAATQATSARLFDGGAVASSRVGVRVGDVTATVDVQAGQSAADIIANLNTALESAGHSIVAETDATGLALRAEGWGTGGSFELNLDVDGAGTWDAVDGVDVAGTIDGVTATGVGRNLSLSTAIDSDAAGLQIETDGVTVGALGDVVYQPGLAARVAEVTTFLTGEDGTFDSAVDAQQRRIDDYNDQIERFERRLDIKEESLIRQWSNLQRLLAGLQEQSNWLQSQIATLPTIGSS